MGLIPREFVYLLYWIFLLLLFGGILVMNILEVLYKWYKKKDNLNFSMIIGECKGWDSIVESKRNHLKGRI